MAFSCMAGIDSLAHCDVVFRTGSVLPDFGCPVQCHIACTSSVFGSVVVKWVFFHYAWLEPHPRTFHPSQLVVSPFGPTYPLAPTWCFEPICTSLHFALPLVHAGFWHAASRSLGDGWR